MEHKPQGIQPEDVAVACIRFPRQLWAAVKAAAFDRRTSGQQFVVDAVADYLKRIDKRRSA